MTHYHVNGSTVTLSKEVNAPKPLNYLPTATYVVSHSPLIGYYLEVAPDFDLPSKLYGDCGEKAERFLTTFADRPGTTGVLLAGAKGSGKSLVMKVTSVEGLKRDIPTLIVSSAYCGEDFNKFIQSIDQPCIMIFDEFEKIYDEEHQQYLLTLFDGTFTTKKLVIVTCNDYHKIDSHMTNRPGRMYYYLKYTGLDQRFIIEYCEDRLNDKSKIQSIVTLSALFYEFNFDMLKAIVEELNRYPNESVREVVSILNINYENRRREAYDISIVMPDGTKLPCDMYGPNSVVNPIQEDKIIVSIYKGKILKDKDGKPIVELETDRDGDYKIMKQFSIPMQDIHRSPDLARLTHNEGGLLTVFEKQVSRTFDYYSLI